MKCRHIQIYNRETEQWDSIKVSSVFHLAVIPGITFPENEKIGCYGINIGIAIPFKSLEDFKLFYNAYWFPNFSEEEKLTIYLIGDKEEKIPVDVRDGNAYDEAYGSCCLFGYIVPDIVASDNRPSYKNPEKAQFGSYLMGLMKNKLE